MLSRGMKIEIYHVPKNQNQETQIILLSAGKPDKVLEVSTRFRRDHILFMNIKEKQALEVILQLYIYVMREEWKLATMCDHHRDSQSLQHQDHGQLDHRGDAQEGLHSVRHARQHGPEGGRHDQEEV